MILTSLFFVFTHLGFYASSQEKSSAPTISNDSVRFYVYDGFTSLYNFEFKSTDSIIKYLKKYYPKSSWVYILEANYYWWKIISGEKTDSYTDAFYNSLELANQNLDGLKVDEKKFLLILIYSFESRVNLMEKKYLTTIFELKRHIHVIKSTFGKEESYNAYYLSSGLYHYLTSVAYSNYIFLRPLMQLLPEGNKVKGIQFLNKQTKDPILETESRYFLMKIFDEVEHRDDLSIKYASLLCKKYPQNFIFQEHYFKLMLRSRKTPLSANELKMTKKTILNNKQLSKVQQSYFIQMTKKLLEINS